jgi:hypothetical protein
MVLRLDLGPAITLQRRMSWAAFGSGAAIYLEGVVVLVLVTEQALVPVALVPIALVLAAQVALVRRPVQQLVRGRLLRSYQGFLVLAAVFIGLLWLGASGRDGARTIAPGLGAFVLLLTSWPVVAAMRTAHRLRSRLRAIGDPRVLSACLAFDHRERIASKLRSFGGDWTRLLAPYAIAILALGAAALTLAFTLNALGVNVGGGGIAQVSTLLALWVFYRGVRRAKLRARELRARDARAPVLILREFGDDTLAMRRFRPGGSFEHLLAGELGRIGPTISVGRPGERLQPLGASRDYLAGSDWKRGVSTLIEEAAVVVFLLGDSASLLWEFRAAHAIRGGQRTLIIVPPLRNRAELARRWAGFMRAAEDAMRAGIPETLPDEPVLGFFAAGADVIAIVGRARKWADYRLVLRLFACLPGGQATSAPEVEAFMRKHLPMISLAGSR